MSESDRKDLEQCWIDSENGLYGRSPDLDGGWCDQAEQLALRIDLPKMKFWEPLRIRNISPWGLGIILLAAQGATLSAQEKSAGNQTEDGIGAYRAGNFSVAEQGWREKLQKDPKDPVARNNLALTYFQMGDKERALAYGLSAYLISPGTSTVGWNTRIFAQAADQLDGSVLGLWDDRGSAWLTSRLGVFGWQALLVLGSVLCALGLGLGLAAGYFESWRELYLRIGAGVLLLGVVTGLTAGSALGVYGKLVDRSAVMIVDVEPLRSIPTEVEPQAEKAYPPGSIAHLEKSFLGWSKIRLPNQDSGWIRTEHLVPLY